MDITKLEKILSVDYILSKVSQELIMSFYFNDDIKIGKKYKNPFRNDKTAGCFFKYSINGNLYFCDYATNKKYFNAIDIASLSTRIDFPNVLNRIESDLIIKKEIFNTTVIKSLKHLEKEKKEPQLYVLYTDIKEFLQEDYDYWNQYGITKSILEFYKVKKVKTAWENNEPFYTDYDKDPCYRYQEKNKYKLYRPLVKNKKLKFRSTFLGGVLEGYTQLPQTGTNLVITKSRKDVMCFHSIGVNAVAVRGETCEISNNAYNILKTRFKNIFIWFDPDEAGIKAQEKTLLKYPDLINIKYNGELGKDPSDIYKYNGKQTLIELCKELTIL